MNSIRRLKLHKLTHCYQEMNPDETLMNRSDETNAFRFVHFPEMRFVIGTDKNVQQINFATIENDGIELVLQTIDETIFRTLNCKRLNEEYD
jgi:lipoate-protein ligase A